MRDGSNEEETPAEIVAGVADAARIVRTPCGEGSMIWRVWGEGPPLVLLHGSFGSWTHWLRCIPALAAERQVIAADLPGMGDSDKPPEPFDAKSLAAILSEGLDILLPRPARFHLAGFSFGGIVGGQLALLQAERLVSLTVVGSNALGLPLSPRQGMQKPNRGMTPAEIEAVHRNNLGIIMLADPAKVDDLAVHLQMENTRRARIRSGDIPRSDVLRRALDEIRCPIAGIFGGRDSIIGPHMHTRRTLIEGLGGEFLEIPGAGHWAAYEAPEAVTAALLRITAA